MNNSLNLHIGSFAYDDQIILQKTDIEYNFENIYVVYGQTGCGKTSLLYGSSSIIPNVRGWRMLGFDGTLTYNNNNKRTEIDKKNYKWFLSQVNVIFQFPDNNFIANTVYEEFKLLKKLIPDDFFIKHDKLLYDLNIRDLANAKINELSEGQKQIIALSCCFLRSPKMIFLDEPLTMLDKENRTKFLSYLKRYKEQNPDNGIVITTHTPNLFASLNPVYISFNKVNKSFAVNCKAIAEQKIIEHKTNSISPYFSSANKSTFLKFDQVHIWYNKGNSLKGLSSLNFSIDAGHNTLLTGLNGAGKSTLAKTICGLHKEFTGNIFLDGKDINFYDPLKNNTVRLVTQIPGNQLIFDTVKEELVSSISSKGNSYIKGILDEVIVFLDKFNISLEDDPLLLSFGQQKVVTLLSHLCFPKLLIIDEPTVSLDLEQQTTILNIIRYYQQNGVTTIIIGHDPEIFYSLCNHELYLEK